jgi:uncharacterized membrane protein
VLRFTRLAAKPLWTLDEAMTVHIALGRSPADVAIGAAQPLSAVADIFTAKASAGAADVVRLLRDAIVQHTHPPLYYLLAHAAFMLHAPIGSALTWWSRALPALLGIVAVYAGSRWGERPHRRESASSPRRWRQCRR